MKAKITASIKQAPRGGAREGAGRKGLSKRSPTVGLSVLVTQAQKTKFRKLGGAPWLRSTLDAAKVSK